MEFVPHLFSDKSIIFPQYKSNKDSYIENGIADRHVRIYKLLYAHENSILKIQNDSDMNIIRFNFLLFKNTTIVLDITDLSIILPKNEHEYKYTYNDFYDYYNVINSLIMKYIELVDYSILKFKTIHNNINDKEIVVKTFNCYTNSLQNAYNTYFKSIDNQLIIISYLFKYFIDKSFELGMGYNMLLCCHDYDN